MRILISGASPLSSIHSYNQNHVEQIKKIAPDAEVVLTSTTSEFEEKLKEADIVVVETVGWHYDIDSAKNLKWIHTMSAGVTDLAKALIDKPILLTNSSGVHPIPIAEHVFGMMLMFSRKLNIVHKNQVTKKEWFRDAQVLKPFELAGLTVGIIGYGRIGSYIAKLAKGFGMQTISLEHKSKIKDDNIDKVSKDLNEVLQADFVVNALPLTSETIGYFDSGKFSQMKETAYFINIGRGKTVVEKELIKLLEENKIAGAALDVFETEPLPSDSPLWDLDNVIISPHYSGWTPKYSDRVIDIFCENLSAYLKNEPMPQLVDKEKGY